MKKENKFFCKIFQKLRPVEGIIIIYFLALSLLLIFLHRGLEKWPVYLLLNFFVIAIIAVMNWLHPKFNSYVFDFFYYWYPILIFLFGFEQAARLNHILFLKWFDPLILKFEKLIYGVYPTIWFSSHSSPWLTETLQFFYFTYYLQFPILGAYFYAKKKINTFNNFLFASFTSYISCFLIYFIFPIEGPYHTLIHLRTSRVDGYLFDFLVNLVQARGGVHGNALPSAHIATSVIAVIFAYKYARKVFYFLFPATIGLCVGAVYGWYHYASDIFAGIIIGLLAYCLFYKLLFNWWDKKIYPLTYD
jgi:membrane-associated phospholipid phosphatase